MFSLELPSNSGQEYIHETVQIGPKTWATKTSLFGNVAVYHCYRLLPVNEQGRFISKDYSCFTHLDGIGAVGDLSTYTIPASVEVLPLGSTERHVEVENHYNHMAFMCEDYIRKAFPQDFVNVSRKYQEVK